jgi:hypothetical protein
MDPESRVPKDSIRIVITNPRANFQKVPLIFMNPMNPHQILTNSSWIQLNSFQIMIDESNLVDPQIQSLQKGLIQLNFLRIRNRILQP